MHWQPGSAAPDPTEGAYSAPTNLLADLRKLLCDGESKRKRDVKEMGREKGRRGEGKVGEEWEGRGEREVKKESHALQFCQLESSDKVYIYC